MEKSINCPEWITNTGQLEHWLSGYELNRFDPENAIINVLFPQVEDEEGNIFSRHISELSAVLKPTGACVLKVRFEYLTNSAEELKPIEHNPEKRQAAFESKFYEQEISLNGTEELLLEPPDGKVKLKLRTESSDGRLIIGIRNERKWLSKQNRVENWLSTAYSIKLVVSCKFGFSPFETNLDKMSYHASKKTYCKANNTGYNVLSREKIEITSLPKYDEPRYTAWSAEGDVIRFDRLCLDASVADVIHSLECILDQVDGHADATVKLFRDIKKTREQSEIEFEDDKRSIETELRSAREGIEILKKNKDALWAFQFLNQVMKSKSKETFYSWKPFQAIFILIQISRFFTGSNEVSVLNFPTGMGKTEAFMGYCLWLAAYQRRTSTNQGTVAIIKYPRVMLSKQQASRAIELISYANRCLLNTDLPKHPFSVGVLYSSEDTPNRILENTDLSRQFKKLQEDVSRNHPLGFQIDKCKLCNSRVTIRPSAERGRILFFCDDPKCDYHSKEWKPIYDRESGEQPVYVSDEEVFRYLPTIILTTTHKFAAFAISGRWKTLAYAGTNKIVSDRRYGHYYYANQKSEVEKYTTVRRLPSWFSNEPIVKVAFSPPKLIVLDETHLISGSQASLLSPIETAFKQVFTTETGPQVICSSATVSKTLINQGERAFQHHAAQLFGVPPSKVVLFPSNLEVYRSEKTELQRTIVAFYPSRFTQLFGQEKVSSYVIANIREETDQRYRTPIYYFGSKSEMSVTRTSAFEDRVAKTMNEPNLRNHFLEFTSDVEPAIIYSQLEGTNATADWRMVLATNTIANGIDSTRFNTIIFNGLPNSTSEYVQARSRTARAPNNCALAVLVLNRNDMREVSFFKDFMDWHENQEFFYEENPVNKFSEGIVQESIPRLFHIFAFWKMDTPERPVYQTRQMTHLVQEVKADLDHECRLAMHQWLMVPKDDIETSKTVNEAISAYLDRYSRIMGQRQDPTIYDFHDHPHTPNTCLPSVSLLQLSDFVDVKLSQLGEQTIHNLFSERRTIVDEGMHREEHKILYEFLPGQLTGYVPRWRGRNGPAISLKTKIVKIANLVPIAKDTREFGNIKFETEPRLLHTIAGMLRDAPIADRLEPRYYRIMSSPDKHLEVELDLFPDVWEADSNSGPGDILFTSMTPPREPLIHVRQPNVVFCNPTGQYPPFIAPLEVPQTGRSWITRETELDSKRIIPENGEPHPLHAYGARMNDSSDWRRKARFAQERSNFVPVQVYDIYGPSLESSSARKLTGYWRRKGLITDAAETDAGLIYLAEDFITKGPRNCRVLIPSLQERLKALECPSTAETVLHATIEFDNLKSNPAESDKLKLELLRAEARKSDENNLFEMYYCDKFQVASFSIGYFSGKYDNPQDSLQSRPLLRRLPARYNYPTDTLELEEQRRLPESGKIPWPVVFQLFKTEGILFIAKPTLFQSSQTDSNMKRAVIHTISHALMRNIPKLSGIDYGLIREYLFADEPAFFLYSREPGKFRTKGLEFLFDNNLEDVFLEAKDTLACPFQVIDGPETPHITGCANCSMIPIGCSINNQNLNRYEALKSFEKI